MRKVAAVIVLAAAFIGVFCLGRARSSSSPSNARRVVYYVDPMHPSYHSAKPGIAPDCGMALVPVYADDLARSLQQASNGNDSGVHADEATRQMYGVQIFTVEPAAAHGVLHFYGTVSADETKVFHVDIGSEGYVKETHGDAVGDFVRKNQHLATIYSPEFLALAGGYLSASERDPAQTAHETPSQALNASGARARADRLRNAGMSDVQIEEMRTNQKLPEDVYVVAPTDGFVLARSISTGMRFERHTEFYTVADLRSVWVLADVFGADAALFRPGSSVEVTLPETGEHLAAHVSSVLPQVNSTSHTLQPRLEVSNPAFHLRPGMFVDITVSTPEREGLTVPLESIVDTGSAKRVFVEVNDDVFAARNVETGRTLGDSVQIVKGLKEGDKVVSGGTFLVDSEARMRRTSF
jgi:Cu(I)/Ag(I) efflux system membrane fusion protein